MKRIVIACDGTWNRLDAGRPTNVAKLAQAVLPAGEDGIRRSSATSTASAAAAAPAGWRGRSTGRSAGRSGSGSIATLAEAYRFLVFTYAPGDEIHLFGFSRGAYTARSLAGLIRTCGILERAPRRRDPRGAGALPGAPGAGPDGAAALAFRARHAAHVTTGPAEAAWRAARGLPAGAAADRLPRGLGHRRRARGARRTCGWRAG